VYSPGIGPYSEFEKGKSEHAKNLKMENATTTAVDVILRDRATEVDAIHALASTLQCNLDRRTVAVLLELLERGVHPEALADIINEIRNTTPR
jgi:hypothetical protein